MISPFVIPLKDDMFLDLRADKIVQVFKGLPFDDRYSNDVTLWASERSRNQVIELKNKFVSRLLVNDKDLSDLMENIDTIINDGTDCVLRCIVFCEQNLFLETMDRVQRIIYKINDARGRNYGGLIFFVVSKHIMGNLNIVVQVNEKLKKDWEYNHITPTLLVTSEEEAQCSSDVLHWLRFRTCAELNKVISSYKNMDTVIDLTEIVNTNSAAQISESLCKIRLCKGYSRTRLYPFSLHRLLFEPNSIHHCSCSSRVFASYFNGELHKGCFVLCKPKYDTMCSKCGISHLCGECGYAFKDGTCIFREIFEKYYSLITQQEVRLW